MGSEEEKAPGHVNSQLEVDAMLHRGREGWPGWSGVGQCILGMCYPGHKAEARWKASERTVGEVEPVPRNEVKARKRLGKIHAYTIDKTIDLTR